MVKCMRIIAAYSYRLSRKHSTIFLITVFVVIVTIILQFYVFRSHGFSQESMKIGDFDYRPGLFLKGKQPNENNSYCVFNYGLPDTLNWSNVRVSPSPENGSKIMYGVIYNAVKGMAYLNYTKYNAVTYATQATPEFIYHVVEIAKYWDGPISLAVYVPDYDLDITMQILNQLCHCYDGMSKVSVHLFYPKIYIPTLAVKDNTIQTTDIPTTAITDLTKEQILKNKIITYKKLDNKTRSEYIQNVRQNKIKRMMTKFLVKKPICPILNFEDCSGLGYFDIPTFRREQKLFYPINVGRNVARNASNTNYFIVSDIEMIPSDGLATKFLAMVRKIMGNKKREEGCVFSKTVFVVPLFEVERGEQIPRDKDTLVQLVQANRATYFHQKLCPHCQRFPGLQTWLLRPSPSVLEPMLIARREYPYHRWEPLYFGTQKEPWYNEALSWEGRQEKMTQMLELCLQRYRLVVLDGGFLCHAAVTKSISNHPRAGRINNKRYQAITVQLNEKYPERPQCKVLWKPTARGTR